MKILITKGLPASGKTTWAKVWCNDNPEYKRINKDDLRMMLDNGKWTPENEKFIVNARNVLIRAAMIRGLGIVIDDTNLAQKHVDIIQEIVNVYNRVEEGNKSSKKYEIEIVDFTHVDLQTCIDRDEAREGKVGEKVIRGMYDQFLKT